MGSKLHNHVKWFFFVANFVFVWKEKRKNSLQWNSLIKMYFSVRCAVKCNTAQSYQLFECFLCIFYTFPWLFFFHVNNWMCTRDTSQISFWNFHFELQWYSEKNRIATTHMNRNFFNKISLHQNVSRLGRWDFQIKRITKLSRTSEAEQQNNINSESETAQ